MIKPKISVVIPVFNTEMYLNTCLDSVINQKYSNIEIIVINDGSTDSSAKICLKYAKKDSRINYIDKKNEGVSVARNIGVAMATGEWIYFLDSDDFLELNTFEVLIGVAEKTGCDLIHFGYRTLKGNKKINEMVSFNYQEYQNINKFIKCKKLKPMPASLTFIKRNILKESGILFNVNMKHNEDLLFVYSLYCHAKKIVVLNNIFYNQVLSENSASRKPLSIKVLDDRILFLSELCNYVRKQGLIQEYKKEINSLSKYIFVLALYYKDFHKYKDEIQKDLRSLYVNNRDVFDTSYFKLANYNLYLAVYLLKASHKIRNVKFIQ